MCLYNLDNSIKDKDFGYKIIRKDGKARFLTSKKLAIGKWLNEEDYRKNYYKKEKFLFVESNIYTSEMAYPIGWHVFYTKKEAMEYNKYLLGGISDIKIVRVAIKDIVAKGYQCQNNAYRTIVCKYIKIEKENR